MQRACRGPANARSASGLSLITTAKSEFAHDCAWGFSPAFEAQGGMLIRSRRGAYLVLFGAVGERLEHPEALLRDVVLRPDGSHHVESLEVVRNRPLLKALQNAHPRLLNAS